MPLIGINKTTTFLLTNRYQLFFQKKPIIVIAKLKALRQHPGFMRYFQNTSWLMGEKILRMCLSLFVGIWVTRYLGPEQFGIFSYAQAFVGLFTAIATLGLDGIVIRELVKDKKKTDVLIGTAFSLKFCGAFLVLFLLILATNFTSNDTTTNTLIFIIASSTIFQSFNVIDFYFQSNVLSRYIVFANTFCLFISSIIKVALILNKAPLIMFAYTVLLDSIILAMGYLFFYFKDGLSFRKWQFKKQVAINLLKDSWPLILNAIVVSMLIKIDQVMIKEMLNNSSAGQYAAAVRLSEVLYFLPIVIANSLFPAILNFKQKSERLYYKRLQNLYDLLVWMAVFITIPILFFSDDIVRLLYGEIYTEASGILKIHIMAMVFIFMGVPSSKWFLAENKQKYAFYRSLAGLILNIALNYQLIPLYSTYGAALATVVSYAFTSYFFNATHKQLFILFKMQTNSLLFPFRKMGINFNIYPK